MARSIFFREKFGPGAWQRAAGTPPFTISGLTVGTVYEIDIGDGTLLERTVPVGGGNLVTNGDFDSAANWTHDPGWSISNALGLATHVASVSVSNLDQILAVPLVQGRSYKLTYTISGYAGGTFRPSLTGGGGSFTNYASRTANGTYQETKVAAGNNTTLRLKSLDSFAGSISNVILELMP